MGRLLVAGLVLGGLALLGAGCQFDPDPPGRDGPGRDGDRAGGQRADPPSRAERPRRRSRPLIPPCRPKAINCKRAGGRVLYEESVDPDGDGDAHVVLASRQGITLPGVTIVDIPRRLRPARLPRRGDRVGASGPVFPGSRGQSQIEARRLRVTRAGR